MHWKVRVSNILGHNLNLRVSNILGLRECNFAMYIACAFICSKIYIPDKSKCLNISNAMGFAIFRWLKFSSHLDDGYYILFIMKLQLSIL